MKRLFGKPEGEEHNFWMSYTDLMSGFLIVFIIASVITMVANRRLSDKIPTGEHHSLKAARILVDTNLYVINDGYYIKTKSDTTHVCINSYTVHRDSTYAMLDSLRLDNDRMSRQLDSLSVKNDMQNLIANFEEFRGTKGKVKVVVDYIKGSVILYHKDGRELFHSGGSVPLDALKSFLETEGIKIIRKAIELQEKYPNLELRIEGHTDPAGIIQEDGRIPVYGSDESFVGNMALSSARANAVYSFLYNVASDSEKVFLRNNAISVGYSFADRIKNNTHKDRDNLENNKSRRIEFRIIAK